MPKKIKPKTVQVVARCQCGATSVYPDAVPVRWKDFKFWHITRRIDITTGQPFLLQKITATACDYCQPDY